MCAGWDSRVAHLASLRELVVTEIGSDRPVATIAVETEPAFIAMGPKAVICGARAQKLLCNNARI